VKKGIIIVVVLLFVFIILLFVCPLSLSSAEDVNNNLIITPASISVSTEDDKGTSSQTVSLKLNNTGKGSIKNIELSATSQFTEWVKLICQKISLNPGDSSVININLKPPIGQRAGTYNGAITFSGQDAVTGKSISATANMSVIIPSRPDWRLEMPSSHKVVKVGEKFEVQATICNCGNVPLTGIKAILSVPAYFSVVAVQTQKISNLNNYGSEKLITWTVKPIKYSNWKREITVTVKTNSGAKSRTIYMPVSR